MVEAQFVLIFQYILIALGVFYLLFEWNMRSYQVFSGKEMQVYPKVSVLVPCRNESQSIGSNIQTLLNQNYPNFEIIAMDDHSEDETWDILNRISQKNPKLSVIRGKELPEGWQGKNHACHQLSQVADGEWLLFVDADTRHHPDLLKKTMEAANDKGVSLLSTFPRQIFHSKGDELLVPLMFFILLIFLPMYFVSKKTWKWAGNFSTACGQFLMVKKSIYQRIGGHGALKNRISEAPLLAKRVKDLGERIALLDGSRWVSCQMYRGFKQTFEGFSRSLYATMGGSTGAVCFFLIVQTALFIVPPILLMVSLIMGWVSKPLILMALLCVIIPIWIRYRIHQRTGMSKKWIALHSVSIALYHWILLNSFADYRYRNKTHWKGRAYVSPKV